MEASQIVDLEGGKKKCKKGQARSRTTGRCRKVVRVSKKSKKTSKRTSKKRSMPKRRRSGSVASRGQCYARGKSTCNKSKYCTWTGSSCSKKFQGPFAPAVYQLAKATKMSPRKLLA